jgi:hypothetical protein
VLALWALEQTGGDREGQLPVLARPYTPLTQK